MAIVSGVSDHLSLEKRLSPAKVLAIGIWRTTVRILVFGGRMHVLHGLHGHWELENTCIHLRGEAGLSKRERRHWG